jgi:VIT1/CCC1 family predicted Fe2+/Mn2+ transporter
MTGLNWIRSFLWVISMSDETEVVEREREEAQASHDLAVRMAKYHGRAIISPRSSLTYNGFSMFICGMSLIGFSWGWIAPLDLSEWAVQLTFLVVGVVGAAIGLLISNSIFYVDQTLDVSFSESMHKMRETVRSMYFK